MVQFTQDDATKLHIAATDYHADYLKKLLGGQKPVEDKNYKTSAENIGEVFGSIDRDAFQEFQARWAQAFEPPLDSPQLYSNATFECKGGTAILTVMETSDPPVFSMHFEKTGDSAIKRKLDEVLQSKRFGRYVNKLSENDALLENVKASVMVELLTLFAGRVERGKPPEGPSSGVQVG